MELFIKPTKQNDDINMLDLEDTTQIMSISVDRSEDALIFVYLGNGWFVKKKHLEWINGDSLCLTLNFYFEFNKGNQMSNNFRFCLIQLV